MPKLLVLIWPVRLLLSKYVNLIAACKAVVSNDSGLMHVAAALERPLVALYGSVVPTLPRYPIKPVLFV